MNNLRVCWRCLLGIECHEGKQVTREIPVDWEDENESTCEWCEGNGFDTLYEFV
jgi:hypothetical protein